MVASHTEGRQVRRDRRGVDTRARREQRDDVDRILK